MKFEISNEYSFRKKEENFATAKYTWSEYKIDFFKVEKVKEQDLELHTIEVAT